MNEMGASPPEPIGPMLRRRRRACEMTLSRLAELSGCSESMVSKIETGRSTPSITLLRRIAAALGVNVTAFFAGPGECSVVSRVGERPRIGDDTLRAGDGVVLERLVAPQAETLLQANIHIVAPGGASDGLISHLGEEMGFLLEGRLDLIVGKETFALRAGDSFHFRSERPHGYRNPGRSVARVLWVNTPPTF